MSQRPLVDFTDKELYVALRHVSENVHYWAKDYHDEIFRRSQDKNTKALNLWTFVIALATLMNAIAAIILLLKSS
jgi:hypothetical protein